MIVVDATLTQALALEARLIEGLREARVAASVGRAPFTIAGGFAEAWAAADRAMYTRKHSRLQLAS